ncbi:MULTISPECIES: hypothetical protein [Dehalobacter]|uniref:Uncharacterized protein n=1 Tax=Dehalobacter restrictus (strain DSM 9455 / PER-K23) TaxID=871738 RepID=A0ABN4C107_DEHRP|nr:MULTISPECIES: hypothetical protein [Dehalobacter]AHF11487.1 hypothetical protein DEHRE_13465 [Dehalobacter restrictus DSM 9455]MDJ0307106.1 hypothetical protein [Dehalobacter sp.]
MLEFKDKVSQKATKEIVSEMTTEMKTIPEDLGEHRHFSQPFPTAAGRK